MCYYPPVYTEGTLLVYKTTLICLVFSACMLGDVTYVSSGPRIDLHKMFSIKHICSALSRKILSNITAALACKG